jgi:hypothetical protein
VESLVVVSPDPGLKRLAALIRGLVDRSVGPLAQHGLNEAFCFAVRSWPIRAGAQVPDLDLCAVFGPGVGHVRGAVIGHDSFDGDAVLREPADRSVQETDAGLGFLIGEHFDVRDAAGVIDTDMHGFPTDWWL